MVYLWLYSHQNLSVSSLPHFNSFPKAYYCFPLSLVRSLLQNISFVCPLPPSSTYFICPFTLLTQTEADREAGWIMWGWWNFGPIQHNVDPRQTNSRTTWIKDDRNPAAVCLGRLGRHCRWSSVVGHTWIFRKSGARREGNIGAADGFVCFWKELPTFFPRMSNEMQIDAWMNTDTHTCAYDPCPHTQINTQNRLSLLS